MKSIRNKMFTLPSYLSILIILLSLMACSDSELGSTVATPTSTTQKNINDIASNLQITYQVISNWEKMQCQSSRGEHCFVSELTFSAIEDVPTGSWSVYFSQLLPVQTVIKGDFTITHINGDLHKVTPTTAFKGIAKGQSHHIRFVSDGWHVSRSDIMPNYYVVAEGLQPRIVDSTRTKIDTETALEVKPHVGGLNKGQHRMRSRQDKMPLATPQQLFNVNADVTFSADNVESAVVPTPTTIKTTSGTGLNIQKGLNLLLNGGIRYSAVEAAMMALSDIGIKESKKGVPLRVNKYVDKIAKQGSYSLLVDIDSITVTASDDEGVANAIRTLASLLMLGVGEIPLVKIDDDPRYTFRGLHIDVARNFHSKKLLLKIVEQMAVFKLNKLHLHLGEDEGWRLQINGLPELTDIGSKRCHDLLENTCLLPQLGSGPHVDIAVNGYYSTDDYIDIVRFANARHIQVIPSFDMPGHSRAAVKSMEARYRKYMETNDKDKAQQYLLSDFEDTTRYQSIQYYIDNTINVCMESSYAFVEKVIDEIIVLHQKAGQPLTRYHIGADETAGAWLQSPRCKKFFADPSNKVENVKQLNGYFIEQVAKILSDKGIEPAGWSDGMGHVNLANMPSVVQSNAWGTLFWKGHTSAHKQLNHGWDIVISTPDVTYFDAPYEVDPFEPGNYWASRGTNTRKVFNFMPDNLPVHAEWLKAHQGENFVMDDTVQRDDNGNITHQPIKKGRRFSGLQGHLWSEKVRSNQRVEYMLFPRLIALAERAWHTAPWELPYDYAGKRYSAETAFFTAEQRLQRDKHWSIFATTLVRKVLPKLDKAGIDYRIPTPGAKVLDGKLYSNIIFPGLPIDYSINNGTWMSWTSPITVNAEDKIDVRARSADGKRKGRAWRVQ